MANKFVVGALSFILGGAAGAGGVAYYSNQETQNTLGVNTRSLRAQTLDALKSGNATEEQIAQIRKALAEAISAKIAAEVYPVPEGSPAAVQGKVREAQTEYKARIEHSLGGGP